MKRITKRVSAFLIFLFVSHVPSFGQSGHLLPEDYKHIFQLAVDHPALQPYFHVDTDSSRKQIYFQAFGHQNQENLQGVTKFGLQVIVLSKSEIRNKKIRNYFVVGDWSVATQTVRLQLEYPLEGLLLSYFFKKENEQWVVSGFHQTEN